MKLHKSVVDKLMFLFTNYGGHEHETKLINAIKSIDLTPYERKTSMDQEIILVLTEDYVKALSGTGSR